MKRNEKNILNREKLLEEGIDLISEYGYHGTGLKKILDRVKIPKGSFYNYFESKEHYVSEIIKRYSDDLMERVDGYLKGSEKSAFIKLKNLYYTAIEEMKQKKEKGCLLGNLAAEIGSASSICTDAMKNGFDKWNRRIVPLIEESQKDGDIREDIKAKTLARLFWDFWEGTLLRMKIDETLDLRESVDLILDKLYKPLK